MVVDSSVSCSRNCSRRDSSREAGGRQGRTAPKALKPVRKRKLVDEMRGDWDVSIRGTWRVFLVDTSTYHYKSRRPDRHPLNNGSNRFAKRAFATAIGASMCYCAAKVGLSVRTRRVVSIAS
jgi:hypothetical protein